MKKIIIIVTSILVVLFLAGIFVFKTVKTNNNESMPDIEQVQKEQLEENEYAEDTQDNSTNNIEESSQEVPQTELKTDKKAIFKLPFKKHQAKEQQPDKNVLKQPDAEELDNVADGERKYSPEEEEALKKIPRSDVVVVDKEIKLKSSSKYRFK